jgi:hypothetical protein
VGLVFSLKESQLGMPGRRVLLKVLLAPDRRRVALLLAALHWRRVVVETAVKEEKRMVAERCRRGTCEFEAWASDL